MSNKYAKNYLVLMRPKICLSKAPEVHHPVPPPEPKWWEELPAIGDAGDEYCNHILRIFLSQAVVLYCEGFPSNPGAFGADLPVERHEFQFNHYCEAEAVRQAIVANHAARQAACSYVLGQVYPLNANIVVDPFCDNSPPGPKTPEPVAYSRYELIVDTPFDVQTPDLYWDDLDLDDACA